jgi:putative 4-mercaptohistidine N1-methyltranferase
MYESPRLLAEYLLFHYGREEDILPENFRGGEQRAALEFARRTVTELHRAEPSISGGRALDLGCAVGRSSFELSRFCAEVSGVDFSASFIAAAEEIRRSGALECDRLEEGSHTTRVTVHRPEDSHPDRIVFLRGDALALPPEMGGYDIVHAANLLCRLGDPLKLLRRLPGLVRPGGELILTTPCTWLAEFTPPENWPRGATLEWLQRELAEHFTLELQRDMPFLIREHARKFQWSVALGTRWRRHDGG